MTLQDVHRYSSTHLRYAVRIKVSFSFPLEKLPYLAVQRLQRVYDNCFKLFAIQLEVGLFFKSPASVRSCRYS